MRPSSTFTQNNSLLSCANLISSRAEVEHIKAAVESTSLASADSVLLGLLGIVIGDANGLIEL